MEVIGCAASVSQLLVYVSSSAVRLHRLCSELRHGNSAYRNEETNINLLLNILQRLSRQDIQDHNPVLPVLIAISGIACQALHLLRPKKVFGINWTPITSQDKIQSAFQSLDKQRELLHLYISQAHHDALVDLRETIDKSTMAAPSGNFTEKSTESTESTNSRTPPTSEGMSSASSAAAGSSAATGASTSAPPTQATQYSGPTFIYSARGSRTEGTVMHMNRETLGNSRLDFDDHVVGEHGVSAVGNQIEPSEQTIRGPNQRSYANRNAEYEAAPQGAAVGTDGQTNTPQVRIADNSSVEITAQWRIEKNKNKTSEVVRDRGRK